MTEKQIDAAFAGLAKHIPRPPTRLIENTVQTVNALNAERLHRSRPEKQSEITKEPAPNHMPEKKKNGKSL